MSTKGGCCFEIGDVVKLTCGGLRMTVIAITDDGVVCGWFSDGPKAAVRVFHEKAFPSAALTLYSDQDTTSR